MIRNKNIHVKVTNEGRISGYFCSDTVFNLSRRVLTEKEIKVLGKGFDYAPVQKEVNKLELRKDFSEFCRRMISKWYFGNEPSPQFSEVSCFKTKFLWRPPNGHPAPKTFLILIRVCFLGVLFEVEGTVKITPTPPV